MYRTVKTLKKLGTEKLQLLQIKIYCLKSGKYFNLNKIYSGLLQSKTKSNRIDKA